LTHTKALNLRRGLFRLWAIGSLVWVAFAGLTWDGPEKLWYATRYTFARDALYQQRHAVAINQCPEMIEIEDARPSAPRRVAPPPNQVKDLGSLRFTAELQLIGDCNQTRALNSEAVYQACRERIPAAVEVRVREEVEAQQRAAEAQRLVAKEKLAARIDACRAATYALPKPDFTPLVVMLLPPTILVALVGLVLIALWRIGRWVWRGFQVNNGSSSLQVSEQSGRMSATPHTILQDQAESDSEAQDLGSSTPSLATVPAAVSRVGFLRSLIEGDFGLARTYWICSIFPGLCLAFVYQMNPQSLIFAIATVVYLGYMPLALVGTWNAARKYEGSRGWAYLAQFSVGLGIFNLAIDLIAFGRGLAA